MEMIVEATPRYGVRIAKETADALDEAVETLGLLGYSVVDGGFSPAELDDLRARFEALEAAEKAGPRGALREAAGELEILRCPFARDPAFLRIAAHPAILSLCERMIGPGFVLNQQNGVTNPAGADRYSQSRYHRDLPYQHFVSTRPLAVNALFCLDPFTEENGATWVIPASHKEEAFPSEAVLRAQRKQVSAPAGSFIVLDCMVWHAGGVNRTAADRRGINHVFTIAMMRQQLDLPSVLGDDFTRDARLRQLIGFDHPFARSVEEFLSGAAEKRRAAARVE